ncbi:MAG TPA: Ig-like domain repeat protein [Thermoanaerobaculia bacterium]|nr:Ig-like domain repeat protein [Thermoanaerobaculia bacterium]
MARTTGDGSVLTFAGNAQHTAVFDPPAQDLNEIHWSKPIDLANTGLAHYGAPLITAANTVLAPVKISSTGFRVDAFAGDGTAKYSLATDYVLPPYNWIPVYQPVVAPFGGGQRIYYPGGGGTVFATDNPDSGSPGPATRLVFYTSLPTYQANAAAFNAAIFINTPITADAAGNIYFGFRVTQAPPAPFASMQSGYARIDTSGNGTFVAAGSAAADASIDNDSHNCAPALSNDGTTLYAVVKGLDNYAYLLGLNPTTLATKFKVFLTDPRNTNGAVVTDDATASPAVGPDNDVYFGVQGDPFNGARGFLLHFNADLSATKTPGAFGWDYTAAIVPAAMVPSYSGGSSYLIFAKYNNYATLGDGNDGVNKIALLDPNATQVDSHPSASGIFVMREVLTVAGPTPDTENLSEPNAVREWCINTAAVNPATNSVFTPSEDGHLYRWNLATNSLSQAVQLTPGVFEPYVPTVIGPGGVVYTLNGGTLFALGGLAGVSVEMTSSSPDVRSVVAGQPVTFTATVGNPTLSPSAPTGTVTFQDTVYFVNGFDDLGSTTTVLAAGVPLDAGGHASVTTSAMTAASHFVQASYSGDGIFPAGSAMLVQKVHGGASTTSLSSLPNPSTPGQSVTFTATVAAAPPASGIPTGMVTFREGSTILAQGPLNGSAQASFSTSALPLGSQTVTAIYSSDTIFAASSGSATQLVQGAVTLTPTSTPTSTPTPTATPTAKAQARALAVDPSASGLLSNGNGVLEPGERVLVRPSWKNVSGTLLALAGAATAWTGPGATYAVYDTAADYGSITGGATADCGTATGNCYAVSVSDPASRPATHWDAALTETLNDGDPPKSWLLHVGRSFTDVSTSHVFYPFVERILHFGITAGCTATTYCPDDSVFRLQMAIFLARAQAGGDGNVPSSGTAQGSPYNCAGGGTSLFTDVPPTDPFCRHVHYIFSTGVTTGCVTSPPRQYCPSDNVTRGQMALFVARAVAGSDAAVPVTYGPDPGTGRSYSCNPQSPDLHFSDITTSDIFCRHVHYLWAKDVISGFPDGSYGPALLVSRGAMSKFLANGFNLQLYGP